MKDLKVVIGKFGDVLSISKGKLEVYSPTTQFVIERLNKLYHQEVKSNCCGILSYVRINSTEKTCNWIAQFFNLELNISNKKLPLL